MEVMVTLRAHADQLRSNIKGMIARKITLHGTESQIKNLQRMNP